MTSNLKTTVHRSLSALVEMLELMGNGDPAMPVGDAAQDFNLLLSTAQEAFPESTTIHALRPLRPADSLVTFLTRVAALKGAAEAEGWRGSASSRA